MFHSPYRAGARAFPLLVATLACATGMPPSSGPPPMTTPLEPHPLIIAHRGASGYLPEHTLAAYARAVEMGADYIEPDLVITRDGILVARHENEIGETTDVADRFPDRRTTKVIDGTKVTGWFTEDLTFAELRTLRARERLDFRSHAHDGLYLVPSFAEVIALADSLGRARGRTVGIYPETKHPSYFRTLGLPLEVPLLAALRTAGLDRADAPVLIQSFEVGNLRALATMTRVRLIQLAAAGAPADHAPGGDAPTYSEMLSAEGLRRVAGYAHGIGPDKALVLPPDGGETSLVRDAHAAGLQVHIWTLRAEPRFIGARFAGDFAREVAAFLAAGVDGLFTDHTDRVVALVRP